jgi:hypothetical protein
MPDVINKVMSFINRDGEGESEKDILLKQIAKDISQNKYAKFYRVRQQEADVSLGQLFYNLYKLVYPMQVFLKDPAKVAKIRQITLEAFLDKKTMDLIKKLSLEAVNENMKAGSDVIKILEDDLAALNAGFDSPRITAADKCHNLIASIKQFVFFDFSSVIRKFDPEFKEGDFLTQLKFSPVDVSVLASDLSAFLSVLPSMEKEDDWKTVFEILKYCRGGTDVIPLAQWTSILANLSDIKQSKILELIARIATANPILEVKPVIPNEALSTKWLENKTNEIRDMINNINNNQRHNQIIALEQTVFGPLATMRLVYYTPEKGKILLEKGLDSSYIYAQPLNHLLIYIQEYLSKEIQELCDILLVRGQWTNNSASRAMSDAFHEALDTADEILKLDESLSEEGSNGPRLKGALLRVDRDKSQNRYINSIISTLNDDALDIINKAVPALIVVGKHFKMLLEDCEKKPFELIMNWKELNSVTKVPMGQRMAPVYKKLTLFVQLMTMEKPTEEE